MFEKDFEKKINILVSDYESAKNNGALIVFDEQELEHIFIYYYYHFDFEKAIVVAEDGIALFKFSFVFYNHKAEVLKEIGETERALEVLEQAEIFSPNEMAILLNKVDILSIQGKFDEAELILIKAVDLSSGKEKAELYLELADVYEDNEKYLEVISSLKNCLIIDNENEEALNRIWFSIELTEDYDNSIKFHKLLIDKNPYNYLAWHNLAHAYKGLKKYEKSIDAFEYVMAIKETFEAAYIDCASIYFITKKYTKAIDIYTEVLDITSYQKDVYFSIAQCYDEMGEYEKSREFYKEVLCIDPYFAKVYYNIGKSFLLTNAPKSALRQLKKANNLEKNNFDFQVSLAEAYLQLEEYQEAFKIYKNLLEDNDMNKQVHLNLITILYEADNVLEALLHIDSIQDKFDDISDLLYIKVAFLYELEKKDEAIEVLYEALEYLYRDQSNYCL